MTKFLGLILASIFSVILIAEVAQVQAQVGDEPITSPLTSPITGPMTSPTETPTPTLINTLTTTPSTTVAPTVTVTPTLTITMTPTVTPEMTTTPTPTYTIMPTITITPMPSATPTPLPSNVIRLGGLNLEGYCAAVGNPWETVSNGEWYCGNGSAKIAMTAACQWQNALTNTFAFQDRMSDIYSWSCYATSPDVTITPTPSITVSPTMTATVTPTPMQTVTPTPSEEVSPTPSLSAEPTLTPTVTPEDSHHSDKYPFHFNFHGFSFKAILAAIHAENHRHNLKEETPIKAKACSIHDGDNHRGNSHKDMVSSKSN
ncbi:MAG TPA: hypothetical protein VLF89_01940 [Candidatus Saccharimonadales bacterium]|nr:hypothetical protein [Candidatus Saccharimonadales bacterium]